MACWDESPYICTYDSGGGKDYSSMATWESDTDVDITGYGIVTLECFDSQDHDVTQDFSLATTDSTHYRRVMSASGCSTPFAGKRGTGATFKPANPNAWAFYVTDPWFRFQDLCFDGSNTDSINNMCMVDIRGDHCKMINLVTHDVINADVGQGAYGMALRNNLNLAYNCIIHDFETIAIQLNSGAGETMGAVCCTIIDGYRGISGGLGTGYAWNCYIGEVTDYSFAPAWSGGGWCGSKNTGAESVHADNNYKLLDLETDGHFASVAGGSEDYTLIKAANWDIGNDERCGRNPYNDFSVVEDFDGFIYNGVSCDPLFSYDIAGNERPDYTNADIAWDVGASQYISGVGGFSDDLEDKLIDHVFKKGAYEVPTNIYIALCTSTVLDSSTGGSLPGEVSGGAYARLICNTWDAASGGVTKNSQTEQFNEATADWGTITHFAVCDHSSTGNVLAFGELDIPKDIRAGKTVKFITGELDVTLS